MKSIIIPHLQLETERVMLRRLLPDDLSHLQHFVVQEPDIWKYSLSPVTNLQEFSTYISEACQGFEAGHSFPFIVFDKQLQSYAGSTRYYDIQWQAGSLQIGYTWYGHNFRRTGLNRHCKYLLFQFAFEQLEMERVELRADAENETSLTAMQAIGCTLEGILRSHVPRALGGRRNTAILSILKQEWYSKVKPRLFAQVSG
ncbi:MAG TPA: GNAT family protein [Phnomibacter sp.]|nr:GNAT family protein [Phnomibacter sp.]